MSGSSCMEKRDKRQGAAHGLTGGKRAPYQPVQMAEAYRQNRAGGGGEVGMGRGQVGGWNSSLANIDPWYLQYQFTAKKTESRVSLKEDLSDSHSKGRVGLKWPSLPPPPHYVCELTASIQMWLSG